MQAFIVSKDLMAFLKSHQGLEGKIHSIFSRAMYLDMASDDLISMITDGEDIAPMSVGIDLSFLRDDRLNRGMKVTLEDESILFPDLNESIKVAAEVWESTPNFGFEPIGQEAYRERIPRLERLILNEGNLEGVATVIANMDLNHPDWKGLSLNQYGMNRYAVNGYAMNCYGRFIIDRLVQFLHSTVEADESGWSKDYEKIVGFGPGLTPSMDDFIAGLMVTFLYLAAYYGLEVSAVNRFNETLYRKSIGKTTRVSEEMLKWASKGCVSNRLREVLVALVSEPDEGFESAVRSAIGYGSTSGTDFLSGVYVANRLYALDRVRRGFK